MGRRVVSKAVLLLLVLFLVLNVADIIVTLYAVNNLRARIWEKNKVVLWLWEQNLSFGITKTVTTSLAALVFLGIHVWRGLRRFVMGCLLGIDIYLSLVFLSNIRLIITTLGVIE